MPHSSRDIHIAWLGHKSTTIGDGLRTYSREVTAGLASRGVEILFIHHEKDLANGHSSYSLNGHAGFQRRFTIAGAGSRRRLERILRDHEVDAVHLSAPFSTLDFVLPELCRRIGVPLIVTFHVPFAGDLSRWAALAAIVYRLYAPTLAACDRVIALGRAQRRLLIDLGIPDHLVVVSANGVDINKYSPGSSMALELFQAERLFSYVGRVDPEKEVDTLLRAFLAVGPPASMRLVIVGDGIELNRLKRRYRDDRVVFAGTILDELTRIAILRASDAFFLPSRVEALSLAMLEAMACGVATAATRVGNHAEVLEGAGVLLRSTHLFEDLREAMRSFIDTPALCRRLGARARLRAAQLFSLDAHLDVLVGLYESLLGWGARAEEIVS
jgi:glycosyltransferase involved in cell wall biosynthesis